MKIKTLTAAFLMVSVTSFAQTISNFENDTLATNTYWNGSTSPSGTTFQFGNLIFPNYYNTAWGGYWQSGWAYGNVVDTTNLDYTNLYGAITGIGAENSSSYAIGQGGAKVLLHENILGTVVNGFYITNASYAYGSMLNGDAFAKKFGGASGNDPDWFKLTIRKYLNGSLATDSVEFYLADFRFQNNEEDYILKGWNWVNLESLGNIDSLLFELTSSDIGQFGMNTPSFFCIDNMTTSDIALKVAKQESSKPEFRVYPNPLQGNELQIFADTKIKNVKVYDMLGNELKIEFLENKVSFEKLANGIYVIEIATDKGVKITKFIKN
jgi:hypothetical protein